MAGPGRRPRAPLRRDDYPYSQAVEARIVAGMGGRVYGPYTGRHFASRRETDIEHMVATSEAHDSGLCAADAGTKRRFSSDLLNLTLAAPAVNRHQKSGKDAGEWLPRMNRCWFAARVVAVKRKYGLTVDARETQALEGVLTRCTSTAMVVAEGRRPRRRLSHECTEARMPLRRYRPVRAGPTRYGAGTRTGTGASPVARRAHTESPRCGAVTRPIASCATGTGTAWCASEGVDRRALQGTGSGGGDSWHSSH